jgi:hypothetical protein
MTAPHGFLIDTDMDYVVITSGSGERVGLTPDQVMTLLDNLSDALDDARSWAPHDPTPDQTYKED